MIREHNITWFLSQPERLMKMKPFTRGGKMECHGYESSEIQNNTMIDTGFANLTLKPISQDTFITEYRPDLHHIIMNRFIPPALPMYLELTYDAEDLFRKMDASRKDCLIPTELVPKCPVCGGRMTMHLRCDNYFVEDEKF